MDLFRGHLSHLDGCWVCSVLEQQLHDGPMALSSCLAEREAARGEEHQGPCGARGAPGSQEHLQRGEWEGRGRRGIGGGGGGVGGWGHITDTHQGQQPQIAAVEFHQMYLSLVALPLCPLSPPPLS